MAKAIKSIRELPTEIIQKIAAEVELPKDMFHFVQSSRIIYLATHRQWATPSKLLQRFYPHSFVAIAATKIREWAESDTERHREVEDCLSKGDLKLLVQLAKRSINITTDDIQILTEVHEEIIPLLLNRLDRVKISHMFVGGIPGFERKNLRTTIRKPIRAIHNFWIYCDLFAAEPRHGKFDSQNINETRFSQRARIRFIQRAIPPAIKILDTYAIEDYSEWTDLLSLTRSTVWNDPVRSLFPDPIESLFGKKDLAFRVIQHSGVTTMKLLSLGHHGTDFTALPPEIRGFVEQTIRDSRTASVFELHSRNHLGGGGYSLFLESRTFTWSSLYDDLKTAYADNRGIHDSEVERLKW